jgi:hypothetical protein
MWVDVCKKNTNWGFSCQWGISKKPEVSFRKVVQLWMIWGYPHFIRPHALPMSCFLVQGGKVPRLKPAWGWWFHGGRFMA